MPFQRSSAEYAPLAKHPDGELEEREDGNDLNAPTSSQDSLGNAIGSPLGLSIPRPLLYIALLIAVLSSLNAVFLPITIYKLNTAPMTKSELEKLPYPSQLMGLDRAARKVAAMPEEWVRAWPSGIARLNKKFKTAVYGAGTQVFISPQDVTLFRFSVPPSNSNSRSCAVAFTGPPPRHPRDMDLTLMGDVSEIQAWSIIAPHIGSLPASQSTEHIDFDQLSWTNRPVSGELLGTMNLSNRKNGTTEEFGCPREGEELLVELRCSKPSCHAAFRQLTMVPKIGFELIRRN